MKEYIKKPHTAIFTGQTGCGKTHLVLELIEKEYNKHFDFIVIICPTLRENSTYHAKEWIKTDDNVWLVDPKDKLYQRIKKLPELLRFLLSGYYLLLTISSLTITLIGGGSPC